MGGVKQ